MRDSIQEKFKTYDLDTDTVAYVLNILRKGTITHSSRKDCLRLARKKVEVGFIKSGPNKGKPKYKRYWQCAECRGWHKNEKDLEVDHILEVGGFKGDWNDIIKKMYCGQFNLQALCISCHLKKTAIYNSSLTLQRKIEVQTDSFDISDISEVL